MAASESLDYLNPFMAATIVLVDGKRLPLWLKTSAMAQSAANLKSGPHGTSSLPFLQELSVEIQLAHLPIIKATLTPPYRDAINFLNSRLIEWGQSQLEVQFGYIIQQRGDPAQPQKPVGRAILSDLYRGILLKPEVQYGQDVTITLNAQGVGGFAAARQEGNLTLERTTRQRIVKALMSRFNVYVDDSEVLKETTSNGVSASLADVWTKVPTAFAQAGDSYWTAAIKVIREAGLHSFMVPGVQKDEKTSYVSTLKILPASFVFSSKPTRIFRLYDFANGRLGPIDGGSTGVNRVLPILSASSPTSAIYLPSSSRGFFVQDVNSFDREEIKKFIGDDEVAPPRTNEGSSDSANDNTNPAADKTTGDGAEMYPGDPSSSDVVQQVRSEYAAQTTLMGVQLTMETVGDPTVLPGQVIAVRGLGDRMSGNYSIFKLTHTIGGSGYTMSMETVSNVAQVLQNATGIKGQVAPQPDADESAPSSGGFTINPKGV